MLDEAREILEERGRPQLTTGQILSVFGSSTTWDYQERHPDGEELALVLDGSIDFLLDDGAGERPVRILKGFGCVVPTGIWHRVGSRSPEHHPVHYAGAGEN